MRQAPIYWGSATLVGLTLVWLEAPAWLALAVGVAVALSSNAPRPVALKTWTTRVLQVGVVALGAGMNLQTVWSVGVSGAGITALGLAAALGLGLLLGKWLALPKDTSLLISVGTAICGGSAIAAVASVVKPKSEEVSIALAVVFVLNAMGLVLFPAVGHALGLSEPVFGRWAALAIHDTSSVVGAGMAYGKEALSIATTTKLARALWIVPLTLGIAWVRGRQDGGGLKNVKWPWFILGFMLMAAFVTYVPAAQSASAVVVVIGRRLLLLALFLIGLSLTRATLRSVGIRPLVMGVVLWLVVAAASLPLARYGA